MSEFSAAEIQHYIETHYLSSEQLAEHAGCSVEQLHALQLAQCIPVHTYEQRSTQLFSSSFGDHAVAEQPQRYYHPSVLGWLRAALERSADMSPVEVARAYREDFERDFSAALDGREPPWPGGVDYAWAYLMDGTWGLCLCEISAENILIKEFARIVIRGAISQMEHGSLDETNRRELVDAVERYRAVALPFAPHELERSSTVQEIERAIDMLRVESQRP